MRARAARGYPCVPQMGQARTVFNFGYASGWKTLADEDARASRKKTRQRQDTGGDVPVRNAYVALHTREKLASATKTRSW